MRQQLPDLISQLFWQSRQHILEIGMRIMPIHARRLDQAHDRRRPFDVNKRSVTTDCFDPKRPVATGSSRPNANDRK